MGLCVRSCNIIVLHLYARFFLLIGTELNQVERQGVLRMAYELYLFNLTS